MLNKSTSRSDDIIQSGVDKYPIEFAFQYNGDDTPQIRVTIGDMVAVENLHFVITEDLLNIKLIPLEEEAPADPNDYSWLEKWVGMSLVIERDIPFVQESDYHLGRISPERIEKDFDLSVMRDQILSDRIGAHEADVEDEIADITEHIADIDATLETKASKAELSDAVKTLNASIEGNTKAITKTRDDYEAADQRIRADMNAKDSELERVITGHTEELTTLRGNQASLGDQVSGIEEKIPGTASATNHLITKQQLLDEEMDIRDDLNEMASELQTQITAQAAEIATKQDQLVAGDNIVISGNTISATGAGGGTSFSLLVVQELPATGQSGVIFLVPKEGAAPDIYNEYVWINATQTFELIGNTQVDLTDYVKNTDYATGTVGGVVKVTGNHGLAVYQGMLLGSAKTLNSYDASADNLVVAKGTLENIKNNLVKRAVTTNDIELTDDEKTAARTWIGAISDTDYAGTDGSPGTIKTSSAYGTQMVASGYLRAGEDALDSYKTRGVNFFIGKGTLENIKDDYVKRGITANTITLTDDEKAAAQAWLGIESGGGLIIRRL